MTSIVDNIYSQMEKNFGMEGFFKADSDLIADIDTTTTGSHALDDTLGVGGIPFGRITQYAGKEGSGKTMMSLIAIREWQRQAPHNCAYFIDAEATYDPTWAAKLGVDNSRVILFKNNDGVKIFERLLGVPAKEYGKDNKKPGLLELIKSKGGARETGLGIIVLDSVAWIQPPMEKQSVAGKANMALMGRFLPPELRKLCPLLSETGVAFIAINQVRVDPGQLWGNPEKSTGGSAWKHACSVMVHFARSESKDNQIYDNNGEQIGYTILTKIDKNKVGPPFRKCDIRAGFLDGVIDKNVEIKDLAVKYGVIERPNNRTYTYGEQKWTSKEEVESALLDENLARKVLEAIKKTRLENAKRCSAPIEEVPDYNEEEEENE